MKVYIIEYYDAERSWDNGNAYRSKQYCINKIENEGYGYDERYDCFLRYPLSGTYARIKEMKVI